MNDTLLATHRFTTTDWYKMAVAGLFALEEKTELIEGTVIDMPPIGTEHCGCVDWLASYFFAHLANRAIVRTQNPLRLSDFSEPQPDLLILKPRTDFYRHAHPQANDVLLLIEVADTSIRYDRQIKMPLYARHGIIEMWLVNLAEGCVEVYREPHQGEYKYQQIIRRNAMIQPLLNSEIKISVSEILG